MARTSHHWHMRINALPSNKTWLCNMPPLSPTHGARHLYTVFWSTRDEDREYRYEYRQLQFAMALDPLLPRAPSPPPHDATREPEGTRMGLGDEHGNEDHKVASHHWHILLSYYPALCRDGETHIQVDGSCRCPPVLFHGLLEHLLPCVGVTSTRARRDLRSFPFPAVPIWRSGRLPSLMDMRRWSDWVGA